LLPPSRYFVLQRVKRKVSNYGIRRTERDFELASVSRELIEKFSKRTLEIERLCKEKYTILEARARKLVRETGMDFADAFAQVKAELGAESRQSKATIKLGEEEQLANWRSQLTPEEHESLEVVKVKGSRTRDLLDREAAESIAVNHLFERSSVARELHVAAILLRRGLGRVSVAEALDFSRQDGRFVRPFPESRFLTTREAMQEETDMLKLAEAGRGKFEQIGKGKTWKPCGSAVAINKEQAAAVEHILRSRDLVTAIRGVAGSGKTSMLDQAVRAIADLSGLDVMAFAPSASATEVMRKHGFRSAATVQKLLADPELQRLATGKLLLIDEAGFLSVREMRQLLSFAADNNCRVILSGDIRQHHSVERGDALRIFEESAAVASAALTKIFRQQIPALRAAIEDLAQGKTEEGFDRLDRFGVIREMEKTDERIKAICDLHIGALKEKQSSLIVAPTHGEGRRIAAAVRKELRAQGLIEEAEHVFARLEKLGLTKGQREDAINYLPGYVVEFHRRAAGGFKSGEQWQVIGSQGRKEIVVERKGERRFLPLAQAGKFDLFRAESVVLSVGDTVRITKNFRAGGTRFRNNELHTVTAVEAGKLTLDSGDLGSRGALHLDQGIVVTSHASQGKTVAQVIVSVPVESFSQANEAQFYVSMSRARKAMHLFTDSKVALREAVTRKSARLSPWELIAGGNGHHVQKKLIANLVRASKGNKKVNVHTKGQIKRDGRGHEVPEPER
jgi:hypothetical protein